MKEAHFPERIEADRIILKKHDMRVAELMFQYVDQDRERLMRFLPWVSSTTTVQHEVDYVKMTHENWDGHESYDYGIFLKDRDLYIGNIGVHTIEWTNDCCELGYWILGQFEGLGYMRESVAALSNAAFDLGFNRVEIRCDPANQRSANVPASVGFRFEARLAQNAVDHKSNYRDTLVFARIKSEGRIDLRQTSPQTSRPDCIKHWSEILSPDDSHYPGSEELLSFGAALGKATGLQKIGIHHEILKPGRRTSWPHAESAEEEFVYVVSGYPSAWINGNLYPLRPGDAVGFPAGTGISHTFINDSSFDAVLLVIGERSKDENKCIYPLHPKRNEEIGEFLWKDCPLQAMGNHDGKPTLLRNNQIEKNET